MPGTNPNNSSRRFDFYKYRTALALGGAATAIVGELCVGGDVENVGNAMVYIGGLISGLGVCQFLQSGEAHDSREP